MIFNQSFLSKKILNILLSSSNILLVSHQKPDGDTLGSSLALYIALKKLGKRVYAFCVDKPDPVYDFLPFIEDICYDKNFLSTKNFHTVVVLDASDLYYTGIYDFFDHNSFKFLINIDHHFTNKFFADLNLVDIEASSTAEIVFNFLKYNRIKIDRQIAKLLLTGILTDTYFFSNPAATHSAFVVSAELISKGVFLHEIIKHFDNKKDYRILRLWGEVLQGIRYNKKWRTAIAVVSEDLLKKYKLGDSEIEGLANFISHYCDVPIILLLKQSGDYIKGSLRTHLDNIDVSKLAKLLGGGGHQKAAGFKIKGRMVKIGKNWKIYN